MLFLQIRNKFKGNFGFSIINDDFAEQSTGNRKTWARIPAQLKATFFHRKIFKFFKILNSFASFAI